MRGVIFHGEAECSVKEFPDPEPGPGQVRVKMIASGICGSDLHQYQITREQASRRGDRIPGHEPCGLVDRLGPDVQKLAIGDRVSVYHYLGCGHCPQCASGNLMWCPDRQGYGGPVNGSHGDYVIADARNCVPLPDSLSFVDGAFLACPGGTGYSAMSKLDVRENQPVAIFGLGPVGLSGLLVARARGGRVIGVEVKEDRLELARQVGAEAVVDARSVDPVKAIQDFTGGEGVGMAFEASGSPQCREQIVSSLRRGGKAVFCGAGNNDKVINPGLLIGNQLTLMGSFVLPLWMAWEAVAFTASYGISFDPLVTHRFPIDRAPEAYRTFHEGNTGKVVFEWEPE